MVSRFTTKTTHIIMIQRQNDKDIMEEIIQLKQNQIQKSLPVVYLDNSTQWQSIKMGKNNPTTSSSESN